MSGVGRKLQLLRGAYGLVLLVLPHQALRLVDAAPHDERVRNVARVLGVRNLGQTLLLGPRASRNALRAGIAVDCLHAASMLGLAAIDRRYRGLALRSAGIATSWALAGLVTTERR